MSTRVIVYDDVADDCDLRELVPYTRVTSNDNSATIEQSFAANGQPVYDVSILSDHKSIAQHQPFGSYRFNVLGDSNDYQMIVTNPSATLPMNVIFHSSWNAAALPDTDISTFRAAQIARFNGVLIPEITSVTLGGLTGGYDVSFSLLSLAGISNGVQTGFSDSSFGTSYYTQTLAPGSTGVFEIEVELQAYTNFGGVALKSPTPVGIQSLQMSAFGSTTE